MSEPASISMGIAARYAKAVFEFAKEDKAVAKVEADLYALEAALADSADFRALISSPVYSRDEQAGAIAALAKKMGLSAIVSNVLALMSNKRRLYILPQLVQALRAAIA